MAFASLGVNVLPSYRPCKETPVSMKWRKDSRGRVYDASEGTVVYFDSNSGDTHLLSDFAAYVIQQFDDRPLTTGDLVNKISPTVDSGNVQDLTEAISGVLEEFVALDILKRE